jgi:hypothetical protein
MVLFFYFLHNARHHREARLMADPVDAVVMWLAQ